MRLKGQILITTLLALTIISLMVATIVIITTRDIKQVMTTERYEQFYNISETELKNFVDEVGVSANISSFFPPSACISATNCIKDISSSYAPEGTTSTTQLSINDTKEIKNLEVKKDIPFEIALNSNYIGTITFEWDYDPTEVNVAFEFGLVLDNAGTYTTLRDVYNPSTITSVGVSGVLFPVGTSQLNKTIITIDLSLVAGNKRSILVTPRIDAGSLVDTILLRQVTYSDPSNIPLQIREFTAISTDPNDPTAPLVKVIARVPLNPQVGALLDYALITEGQLRIQ